MQYTVKQPWSGILENNTKKLIAVIDERKLVIFSSESGLPFVTKDLLGEKLTDITNSLLEILPMKLSGSNEEVTNLEAKDFELLKITSGHMVICHKRKLISIRLIDILQNVKDVNENKCDENVIDGWDAYFGAVQKQFFTTDLYHSFLDTSEYWKDDFKDIIIYKDSREEIKFRIDFKNKIINKSHEKDYISFVKQLNSFMFQNWTARANQELANREPAIREKNNHVDFSKLVKEIIYDKFLLAEYGEELLRHANDLGYVNDPNDPWNLSNTYNQIYENGTYSSDAILVQTPNSNTNMYSNFGTALIATYMVLAGLLSVYKISFA
ncbi:928_t:CDS:2 [Racocetra fulgida]|uniref:928_t:CDS:1 n=1 Tax=Racocetra fulgida TaxID=60492 RepID=A0A9N9FT32_9GLOM|nr:928_t:CDS:2 [Racocetra fulgida]